MCKIAVADRGRHGAGRSDILVDEGPGSGGVREVRLVDSVLVAILLVSVDGTSQLRPVR